MTTKERKELGRRPMAVTAESIPKLYVGATTCDFYPKFVDCDEQLGSILDTVMSAPMDDLTPQLVLADALADRSDEREFLVRRNVAMWIKASEMVVEESDWDQQSCEAELAKHTDHISGWMMASAWGVLLGWHGPTGYGDPVRMGLTWVDVRVEVVNKCLWLWSMGFLSRFKKDPTDDAAGRQADAAGRQADAAWSQAYAAWSQAYAAWSQADVAGRQAYAAWRQADVAGRQADAAGRQADVAGRQADAAWSQAYAAGRQADAAWSQAYAAGRQADVAGRQADAAGRQADAAGSQAEFWRFARALWFDVCLSTIDGGDR